MLGIHQLLRGSAAALVVAAAVGCASADGAPESIGETSEAITGGTPVANAATSGIVAIYEGVHLLGSGVLLRELDWIVTTSHVLGEGGERPANLRVRLGNANDPTAQERAVVAGYVHPSHGSPTFGDVAVLRLASALPGPALAFGGSFAPEAVKCFGYGSGGTLTSVSGTTSKFLGLTKVETPAATPRGGDFGGPCLSGSTVAGLMLQTWKQTKQTPPLPPATLLAPSFAFSSWATQTRADCANQDPRSPSFCSAACPCVHGESDCDRDNQCTSGLVCAEGSGPAFGYSSGDACVNPACTEHPPGDRDYCSDDCPCGYGGGVCERDPECQGGYVCRPKLGQAFGNPHLSSVCLPPTCFTTPIGSEAFCSKDCPCGYGGGDCDSDDECLRGLVCRPNVGGSFGMPATSGVCVPPTCQTQAPSSPAFCSASCRCGVGGSCESSDECTANLQCASGVCKFKGINSGT